MMRKKQVVMDEDGKQCYCGPVDSTKGGFHYRPWDKGKKKAVSDYQKEKSLEGSARGTACAKMVARSYNLLLSI
jgi:hypothetical protein